MSSGHKCGPAEAGSSHTLRKTSNTNDKKITVLKSWTTACLLFVRGIWWRESHLGSWWHTEPENLVMSADSLFHLIKVASVSCVGIHTCMNSLGWKKKIQPNKKFGLVFGISEITFCMNYKYAVVWPQNALTREIRSWWKRKKHTHTKTLTEQSELRVCTHPELSFWTQQPDPLSKSLASWIRLTTCESWRMHGANLAPKWMRSSWRRTAGQEMMQRKICGSSYTLMVVDSTALKLIYWNPMDVSIICSMLLGWCCNCNWNNCVELTARMHHGWTCIFFSLPRI